MNSNGNKYFRFKTVFYSVVNIITIINLLPEKDFKLCNFEFLNRKYNTKI